MGYFLPNKTVHNSSVDIYISPAARCPVSRWQGTCFPQGGIETWEVEGDEGDEGVSQDVVQYVYEIVFFKVVLYEWKRRTSYLCGTAGWKYIKESLIWETIQFAVGTGAILLPAQRWTRVYR